MKSGFIIGLLGIAIGSAVWAQDPPPSQPPAAAKVAPKNQEKDKKKEIPPAENITLETKDRVNLNCTWFPGVNEKEAVPVLLVHDWGSQRSALLPLAQKLQTDLGCAVIVPDLRGHGGSTQIAGSSVTINPTKFGKADFPAIANDLEACKRFLVEKHNAGELNIEMLTVLACNQTTPLAMTWAVADWSWPSLGGKKQGQDVKALILLTPQRKFESLNITALLKSPILSNSQTDGITTVMFWDSLLPGSEREAGSIDTTLRKGLGPMPSSDAEDRWERLRILLKVVDNGGVGEELLANNTGELVIQEIGNFIQKKLIDRKEKYTWQDRTVK